MSQLEVVDVQSLLQPVGGFQKAAAKQVSYRYFNSERHAPVEPSFLVGPVDPSKQARHRMDTAGELRLGVYCIRDAFVFGRGLVALDGGAILVSGELGLEQTHLLHPRWKGGLIPSGDGRYRMGGDRRIVELHEPAVLLMKRGDHIYGHWLIDALPRLELLGRCGVTGISYVISKHSPAFARELLELAGVSPDAVIEIDEDECVLWCRELYWPSLCRVRAVLSDMAGDIYSRLAAAVAVKGTHPERVFLPRAQWPGNKRRLVNADEVAECLARNGFHAVRPEQLSIGEQVVLFKRARVIVAECGSAPHNAVFSDAHTKVAILQGNHTAMFIQSAIGRLRNQPTGYLFGESFFRPDNGINGDYLVSVKLLERILREKLEVN